MDAGGFVTSFFNFTEQNHERMGTLGSTINSTSVPNQIIRSWDSYLGANPIPETKAGTNFKWIGF